MDKRRTAMASDRAYVTPQKASSMLGFQCRHLGYIPFNRFNEFFGAPLFLKSRYPQYCDVNTVYLPNGAAYLSLYIRFDELATARVKDIDVTHVQVESRFLSLNPFNKSFGIRSTYCKESAVEKLINNRAAKVVKESLEVVDVLLRLWGKGVSSEKYNVVADFVSHSGESTGYFSTETPSYQDTTTRVVIDPRRQFSITARSTDLTGVFMEYDVAQSIGVDAVFVKSEPRLTAPKYGISYLTSLHYGLEEFAGLQYVKDVEKRLLASADEISAVFTSKRVSSRKSLSVLIAQSLSLNLIDERIDALKNSGRWFDKEYQAVLQQRIENLEKVFDNLRDKIQKRRDQSHDEVQLTQLRWTKRNAWLLVGLALVQITIALVVVDWTEGGINKNAIYLNWHSLTSYITGR